MNSTLMIQKMGHGTQNKTAWNIYAQVITASQ